MALADLTTLRVGGAPAHLVDAFEEDTLVAAIVGADEAGAPVLQLGGGSNVVCGEDLRDLTEVRDRRGEVSAHGDGHTAHVTAQAGASWDALVGLAVEQGWSGFEALAGIPGSVGATPVQNVGAYGHEVAELISSVRAWDRLRGREVALAPADLDFAYRDSALKRSTADFGGLGPRWIVLSVSFEVPASHESAPVAYTELARTLGVAVGDRAPAARVREAVLALRRGKGMLLDPEDHDTWSAGSFFTNPILSADAAALLPSDAPRFPVAGGRVKTSAAWLISHAGIAKGWGLRPEVATTSTKHVLALTNRGGASGTDIVALAAAIRDRVRGAFGVSLVPEPSLVGLTFPS